MTRVHNYNESLALAQTDADSPFWWRAYDVLYPGQVQSLEYVTDPELQQRGVDRIVHLKDGRSTRFEEKSRSRWYSDILLEYWSNRENGTLGWAVKSDPLAHYLLYAIPSANIFFCARYADWRRAAQQLQSGLTNPDYIKVPNNKDGYRYTTWNHAVQPEVLHRMIDITLRVVPSENGEYHPPELQPGAQVPLWVGRRQGCYRCGSPDCEGHIAHELDDIEPEWCRECEWDGSHRPGCSQYIPLLHAATLPLR